MRLRVLLVEGSAPHRRFLVRALAGVPALEVAGVAAGGEDAVKKVVTLRPDLVALDLELPGARPLAFLRWLMRTNPRPTLVLSSRASDANVFRALELGAADFTIKPAGRAPGGFSRFGDEVAAKLAGIAAVRTQSRDGAAVGQRAVRPSAPPKRTARAGRGGAAVSGFGCVAIGASTGGPLALHQVLGAFRPPFPAAVVIAQHMPAGFTRVFARRLDRLGGLRVREAEEGEELAPGIALLAPGGKNLALERSSCGRVFARVESPEPAERRVPSVDRLLTTGAVAFGGRLVAVVLTGMGDDGAAGIRAARAAGGTTIVQDEGTCVVFGMPREAIRTGAVQRVLPLESIGPAVAREVVCGLEGV